MLTGNQFEALGKELIKRYPDIAEELIPTIQTPKSDLTTVSMIAELYCKHLKISYSELKKPSKRYRVVRRKEIFIAIVIRFLEPENLINVNTVNSYGFIRLLSTALEGKKSSVSNLTKKARFFYLTYQDFKSEVDQIYKIIQNAS